MKEPKKKNIPGIELRPDGWERFEQAVVQGAKTGPKHRESKPPKKKVRKKR
jgi:hypothetical protein